jgi:hypothetical protein
MPLIKVKDRGDIYTLTAEGSQNNIVVFLDDMGQLQFRITRKGEKI